MKPANALEVNAERLWASLDRAGEIGRCRGTGVRRLALTQEDKEVRDLFVGWVREAGCSVEVDAVGNIFARRAGTDNSLPAVAITVRFFCSAAWNAVCRWRSAASACGSALAIVACAALTRALSAA